VPFPSTRERGNDGGVDGDDRGEVGGPWDWASLGDLADVGPLGWLAGVAMGLLGYVFFRRKRGRK